MCLNQIFKDEQLVIMRYTSAPSRAVEEKNLEALRQLRLDFHAFPYPHHPYIPHRLPTLATGRHVSSHIQQGND